MCGLRSGICKLNAFRFGKTALKEGLKPEANNIFHTQRLGRHGRRAIMNE